MKKMKWIILTGTAVLIIALCCVLFILRHGSSDYGGVMDGDGMINPVASEIDSMQFHHIHIYKRATRSSVF